MSSYTITHHGTDQVFRINHHGIPTKQEFYYSRRKWIMNTILLPPFLIALWLLPVLGVWVIGDKEMLMFWAISLLLTGGAIGNEFENRERFGEKAPNRRQSLPTPRRR